MLYRIGRGNLIDVLMARHRDIDDVCSEVAGLEEGSKFRASMVQRLVTELARHAEIEARYLYPTVRDVLHDGTHEAEHHLAEHDRIGRLVTLLERTEFGSEARDEAVDALVTTVRRHIRHEEDDLLPRLGQACPDDQLEALGRQAELTDLEVVPEALAAGRRPQGSSNG